MTGQRLVTRSRVRKSFFRIRMSAHKMERSQQRKCAEGKDVRNRGSQDGAEEERRGLEDTSYPTDAD